jgi:hypothetical protein
LFKSLIFLFFQPKEGISGTNTKSALLSLISEGNKFPDNYFWDIEKVKSIIYSNKNFSF